MPASDQPLPVLDVKGRSIGVVASEVRDARTHGLLALRVRLPAGATVLVPARDLAVVRRDHLTLRLRAEDIAALRTQ